jgi:hypothetical protein
MSGARRQRNSHFALRFQTRLPSLRQTFVVVRSGNRFGSNEEWDMDKRGWSRTLMAAGFAALTASAFAGQITLYESAEFQGRTLTTGDPLPDLERSAFNQRAGSAVVNEGRWEVCTDRHFGGTCAELVAGAYDRLGVDLQGRIGSVRPIGTVAPAARVVVSPIARPVGVSPAPAPVVITPGSTPVLINPGPPPVVVAGRESSSIAVGAPVTSTPPVPANPRITLYQRIGDNLRRVELTASVDDLGGRNFNDAADAAFVSSGVWQLCDGNRGLGSCVQLSPGEYASLGALSGRVSSAYLISAAPAPVATVVTVAAPPATTPAPVAAGRMVLYAFPNYGVPSAVVERGRAPDLDWAHFRHPASSVRIESGTWLVCSEMGYQGECRVLEPGNYPSLDGVLRGGIASARQLWRPQYGSIRVYR